ncbi:hypothetical protein Kpol_1069p10 [Vanderwaltozyma polyspora DSM 70294]|uniref:CSC1/OSCA1-like 7TM region domain-containing protein n=1 Tax=Vanderwaltozyma polyspora (strain ATCC 22028 / DSM 70294 / BCRC 21397 / CBS 2163 / NBRC 10782 / NRRL Y-8283 / UCD 57-17) TaxID=436907 RepID=A7TRC0_VANPO|nr:uncharacterized protein Kpol_1069p10 [Vanderwaltozyma polyspora DSM 70294]EDO15188.1 hypothetical protein Kpol_1069p10 [Vanderwaltozyma polyspora DSM 70294]
MSTYDKENGTSTQQVLTALAANSVLFGAFMTGFLLLRLKLKRIYEPKSSYDLINEEKKPEPLPSGLWQWFIPLLKKSDNFIIQQAGLDGYLFLRYLFIIFSYCAVSMLYIFPILLPVNAANGNNETGLNILAYQNIKDSKRYYAHVFISWIFFWGFLFIVYRELYYYNSLRQNVLSSNRYAKKLSSKTVLFQNVPDQYLSETEFTKLFSGVKKIWIARSPVGLDKKVKERDDLAYNLEGVLTAYLQKAIKKINKIKKKDPSYGTLIQESTIDDFVKKPKHRENKWKLFFSKKIDTFEYYKNILPEKNEKVAELQSNQLDSKPINSVFVLFESQYHAQIASQVLTYHGPLNLTPAYIGIDPKDIIWFNLRMYPVERLIRKSAAVIAIVVVVILWSFPVAFVGMISNITYLTNKLHWLNFIYKLPDVLLGILTSLAPTIALALLMMCLPIFIRAMAFFGGAPSHQNVERFTQQAYFAFQVIQVFLVTTITSAATSTVTQIVENPASAMFLLATNLPKASNFYIAYIVLQGMAASSGMLLQFVPLLLYYLLGNILDKTPRKKFNRFNTLSSVDWGTTFPIYTNLAVIVFSYAIISPIILLFGAFGFFLLWVSYLYNLNYVYQEAPDSRGVHYPRALFQTIVGIYIGQICLLGLFVFGKGWGPIVLQCIGLGVTLFIHLMFNHCFDHLIKFIPIDTMKPLDGKSETVSYINLEKDLVNPEDRIKELPAFPIRKYHSNINNDSNESKKLEYTYEIDNKTEYPNMETSENNMFLNPLLADGNTTEVAIPRFWKRFFNVHEYSSYKAVKTRIPEIYHLQDPNEKTDDDDIVHAYDYPAVSAKCPFLWIPKDPYGFSDALIEEFQGIIKISNEGAYFDDKGNATYDSRPPSYDDLIEEEDIVNVEFSHRKSKDDLDPFDDSKEILSSDSNTN